MNQVVSMSNTKHKKRAIAISIACSFLLVLPSCGIPHLRHPELAPPPPESFIGETSPENSSQVKIEEFFDDPMLTTLIYQALAGSQELRIRSEEVQIASNEILARRGAYLPFVTIGGGAGLTKFSSFTPEGAGIRDDQFRPGQYLPNPLPNFILGGPAGIWWQLDVWRQLRNARDAAGLRYFATAEGRNYFVTSLVAEIADTYYGLIALDKRLENLNNIIALQEQSLRFAEFEYEFARGTDLAVQRFRAEVRKNQSERLIVLQDIIQTENRINFIAGRFPQPVARVTERSIDDFIDLSLHALSVGVPSQLLQNRPDIRQAERELVAAGLDIKVARANFYPRFIISSGVGYQAFNPKYLLLTPEALIYNIAGDVTAPLINKKAIQADYLTANARQLQTIYNYQRVIINAVTEVVNRLSKVQNYRNSIEIKKQQVTALAASVEDATQLFRNARTGYIDVLFAQRDLLDARRVLIDTKREQLSAIVNTYQALGGGAYLAPPIIPQSMHLRHKWHLWHSQAGGAAERGPDPNPTPPAPPGDRGPDPNPTPPSERLPEPLPAPKGGGTGSGDGKGSGTNGTRIA
jgi:NodT family efflux transporter outer membrane factor (OMF) lipoprotein